MSVSLPVSRHALVGGRAAGCMRWWLVFRRRILIFLARLPVAMGRLKRVDGGGQELVEAEPNLRFSRSDKVVIGLRI